MSEAVHLDGAGNSDGTVTPHAQVTDFHNIDVLGAERMRIYLENMYNIEKDEGRPETDIGWELFSVYTLCATLYSMMSDREHAEVLQNVKSERELRKIAKPADRIELFNAACRACREKRWRIVYEHPLLQRDSWVVDDITPAHSKAIMDSWDAPYIGDAPEALLNHIQEFCSPRLQTYQTVQYRRFFAVIQSSGMGKSRLVDELSKTHFVIKMNMGERRAGGFPPPDFKLRNFFTGPNPRPRWRLYLFLMVLFKRALEFVQGLPESLGYAAVASAFRDYMQEGQTVIEIGPRRDAFFLEVRACTRDAEASLNMDKALLANPPLVQLNLLTDALKKRLPKKGKRTAPLVLLAFDDCQTLNVLGEGSDTEDTIYTCLQDVMKPINKGDIATLFLSSDGKIGNAPSHQEHHRVHASDRIMQSRFKWTPAYTDLGFDQMMHDSKIVADDPSVTLEYVSSVQLMAKFGRPLFGSRLRASNDTTEILNFATHKLLNAAPSEGITTAAQKLACLSRRLAISFRPEHSADHWAEEEQVAHHLRVCLWVPDENSNERVATESSSEPLVSEAAARVMFCYPRSSASLLGQVLDAFPIEKEDKGALVCMQLLLDARDAVVYSRYHNTSDATTPEDMEIEVAAAADSEQSPDDDDVHYELNLAQIPSNANLVFSLTAFFQHLFHADLSSHTPSLAHPSHTGQTFSTLFANARMHFNHIIRVHELATFERKYLAPALVRGAALLYTAGGSSCGLIPFVYHDAAIRSDRLGAILWESATSPTANTGVDGLDPRFFGTIGPSSLREPTQGAAAPIPLIRLVFGLSDRCAPGLTQRKGNDGGSVPATYTAFDYWCSGASSAVLKPILPEDEPNWTRILTARSSWEKLFGFGGELSLPQQVRRAENPLAGMEPDFYGAYFHGLSQEDGPVGEEETREAVEATV